LALALTLTYKRGQSITVNENHTATIDYMVQDFRRFLSCIPKGLPESNNMITQMKDGRDRARLRFLVNELRSDRKNWCNKHVKQNYSMAQIHQRGRPSHTVKTENT